MLRAPDHGQGASILLNNIASRSLSRTPPPGGRRVARASAFWSIYLKPEARKQLRMLSVNLERSSQSLGEEALSLLFEKHRLTGSPNARMLKCGHARSFGRQRCEPFRESRKLGDCLSALAVSRPGSEGTS